MYFETIKSSKTNFCWHVQFIENILLLQCLKKETATAKELDLRPLGKVIIFRDRQTDRQNLPIIYRCSLSGHAHCSRSMGEEAHLLNSHSKFTISFYFSTWEVTKSSLIFNVCSFQIYCFGTCITFLIIIGDQVVIFLKNHAIDISIIYGSLTAPLRA